VIKLRILSWDHYQGLPRRARYNHKGLYNRETGRSESVAGDLRKQGAGVMRARAHEQSNARRL
jgi:hypothetical protein